MHYLYTLRGPRSHLHIGSTQNIEERIQRHMSGDGAEFTERNNVYELVYKEEFMTKLEAKRRESR